MKILFFNEYTSIYGGTDTVIDAELNALKKSNVEVRLSSFRNKDFVKASVYSRIKIYTESCGKFLSNSFQKEIIDYDPDIIHFHNVYQIFRTPLWYAIKPGRAKIVLHMHNFYPFCLNSLMYRKGYCNECLDRNSWKPGIRHSCYNKSFIRSVMASYKRIAPLLWLKNLTKISRIIVVSDFLLNKLDGFGIPRYIMEVLPNPVTILEKQTAGNYILYLGNIIIEKGIVLFCEVARRMPWLKFIVGGDGRDLNNMKSKYKRVMNLEFYGYITGSDKVDILNSCRFLYFPTQCQETFGMVILEAFSFGKPVLTTGYGATKEIVQDGFTGIINSDPDISSQQTSVQKLWNEAGKDDYYSNNCFDFAKRYSAENHIKQLIKVYHSL